MLAEVLVLNGCGSSSLGATMSLQQYEILQRLHSYGVMQAKQNPGPVESWSAMLPRSLALMFGDSIAASLSGRPNFARALSETLLQ